MGNISGIEWNPNGLIQTQEKGKFDKAEQLMAILHRRDFAVITETHSSRESVAPYTLWLATRGYMSWWSHLTDQRAGVGIIMKKEFFETNFCMVERIERKPGRILSIRLRSSRNEELMITGAYLTANPPQERNTKIELIMRGLSANHHHIIAGDFNFTAHAGDRLSMGSYHRWDKEADPEASH